MKFIKLVDSLLEALPPLPLVFDMEREEEETLETLSQLSDKKGERREGKRKQDKGEEGKLEEGRRREGKRRVHVLGKLSQLSEMK